MTRPAKEDVGWARMQHESRTLDGPHPPPAALHLLAALKVAFREVDALSEAERHLQEAKEALGIEPGDNLAHRIRMAKESGEHQVRVAEQRAEAAELAWTELHQAAVSFEAPLSEWCDGPLRDALWKALAAKPTDLAEAQRRELRAEGAIEAVVVIARYSHECIGRYREQIQETLDELVYEVEQRAAELRGPK